MNVMLISQCEKNALSETRRIIDQFAERRGDRVWQTAITQQGLDTLRRMLKRTARKNTAVACHWIRGLNRSELLWVVGAAVRFGERGAVPTNVTWRNVLRSDDEHDWSGSERVRVLAALAALWHDMGKASLTFQRKLTSTRPCADPLRHEWISLRLWQAYIGDDLDEAWLKRLAMIPDTFDLGWMVRLQRDDSPRHEAPRPLTSPFKRNVLPPLARVIGWLLVSHHRLPVQLWGSQAPGKEDLLRLPAGITAAWCGSRIGREDGAADSDPEEQRLLDGCYDFNRGLPCTSKPWVDRVRKHARRVLADPDLVTGDWLKRQDPYTLHLSRLVLMLADHHYSSLSETGRRVRGDLGCQLFANTLRRTGEVNQRLDEHLIGVEIETGRIAHQLPSVARQLPRVARHKGFVQRTREARFTWQNEAYDLAASLRERSAGSGFFGINMASTGLGKTLANGRIMYALSDPKLGARFTIALGLRTLTLQTGRVYRDRMGLGSDDLAVLVGGGIARELFERTQRSAELAPGWVHGSESIDELLDEHCYVHYEGALTEGPLCDWLSHTRGAAALVHAPVLACTIDHLVPATEGLRGGKQIAPMLRLMTADLVLDEPDDFGIEDLPALARLIHWAGLLGTRVLLSSATLPPSLVEGLFEAYVQGRSSYWANHARTDQVTETLVAWFDEFGCRSIQVVDSAEFSRLHREWARRRCALLAAQGESRRLVDIATIQREDATGAIGVERELASVLVERLHVLHGQHHSLDPHSQKRVSFGLVRMANIQPLVEVTRALAELGAHAGHRLVLVCYHAQYPLLVRSLIEQRLDCWLQRHDEVQVFEDANLRAHLASVEERDQIIVVLATPVAEVGRDHDYDWAVVEPSSMRSIIQVAGRVRRHRQGQITKPNLLLLSRNLRALRGERPAYCKPGFESVDFMLETHDLRELLTEQQLDRIDASSRVLESDVPDPARNLVDLEHARLRAAMQGDAVGRMRPAALWWQSPAHLCGELQRVQPFRQDVLGRHRYALELADDGESACFLRCEDDGTRTATGHLMEEIDLADRIASSVSLLHGASYVSQVETMATELDMGAAECARRFGVIDLPASGTDQGFFYHPALGFWRRQ